MELSGHESVLMQRIKKMVLEVFKCISKQNPPCISNLFEIKEMPYSMRNQLKITQPKRATTRFGLRTFSYTGAKLWNELPFDIESTADTTVNDFKRLLEQWEGPDLESTNFNFV